MQSKLFVSVLSTLTSDKHVDFLSSKTELLFDKLKKDKQAKLLLCLHSCRSRMENGTEKSKDSLCLSSSWRTLQINSYKNIKSVNHAFLITF